MSFGFQALYVTHDAGATEREDMEAYVYRTRKSKYSARNRHMNVLSSGHYLRNRSTLDIRVLGYIGIL
jgi:hypothetical protein